MLAAHLPPETRAQPTALTRGVVLAWRLVACCRQHAFTFALLLGSCLLLGAAPWQRQAQAAAPAVVFPGEHWTPKPAAELAIDAAALDAVAESLGGRGCVIKQGYLVRVWGAQDQRGDWYSSAKPVLSTLLLFAWSEGLVRGLDQPVAEFGWQLETKDRTMTLRHLASMTSGYARPEPPGAAWAYNDYAIQLYQKTLFDRVFQAPPDVVFHDPRRFGALGLEDGFEFRQKNRRMSASVRDFARVAWFWLQRGQWAGTQILPRAYFDEAQRPQVPADLPLSSKAKTNDYLGIGTYGGESNHFSQAGPGIYGGNWWFNTSNAGPPDEHLTWPDAPRDTFLSVGHAGNCSAMIPSLSLVVVAADADWGAIEPGRADSLMNQRLKTITLAGTPVGKATP